MCHSKSCHVHASYSKKANVQDFGAGKVRSKSTLHEEPGPARGRRRDDHRLGALRAWWSTGRADRHHDRHHGAGATPTEADVGRKGIAAAAFLDRGRFAKVVVHAVRVELLEVVFGALLEQPERSPERGRSDGEPAPKPIPLVKWLPNRERLIDVGSSRRWRGRLPGPPDHDGRAGTSAPEPPRAQRGESAPPHPP